MNVQGGHTLEISEEVVCHLHQDPGPVDGVQAHQVVPLNKSHISKHGLDGLIKFIAVPFHCQGERGGQLSGAAETLTVTLGSTMALPGWAHPLPSGPAFASFTFTRLGLTFWALYKLFEG